MIIEIITYYTSSYSPNSLHYLIRVLSFICFYFFIVLYIKTKLQSQAMFILAGTLAILFSLLTLLQFNIFQFSLERSGFSEYIHFKNLFRPFDFLVNEWSTVFLGLLPFPIGLYLYFREYKYMWLLPFGVLPIIFVIIVSFSRGLYLALFVWWLVSFLLFLLFKIIPWKKLLAYNTILILAIVVFASPLKKSTAKTTQAFSTTSQVRSFSGRLNLWKSSLQIIKENPVMGVGSFNFPMYYVAYKDNNKDTRFAGRAFNTFLQILIEKGLLGLAGFLVLCGGFFWSSFKKLKNDSINKESKGIILLFMTTVFALLVRDLSYSTLLYFDGVCILFWLMLAMNTNIEVENGE